MLLLSFAFAAKPAVGVGALLQGARPGLIFELQQPVFSNVRRGKTSTLSVVPTVSGWIHPGHQLPVSAHVHLEQKAQREGRRRFLLGGFGVGGTWVVNARRTVRLTDGNVQTVPLAGNVVFSPSLMVGAGHQAPKHSFSGRLRVAYWTPWQHNRLALTWNLEAVVRFGGRS